MTFWIPYWPMTAFFLLWASINEVIGVSAGIGVAARLPVPHIVAPQPTGMTNIRRASSKPCGYIVTDTLRQRSLFFTEVIETDFLHMSSIAASACWSPQTYTQNATISRGPFGKSASPANVVCNPYPNSTTWTGQGILGGDAGLQLWVRGEPVDGYVGVSEIASRRKDAGYGSYRLGMKATRIEGTCAGFFWYHNDSAELDTELLSSAFNSTTWPVKYVMQTGVFAAAGFDASGTPGYATAFLPADPTAGFHEYRIDYTDAGVDFFFDGVRVAGFGAGYDVAALGNLVVNHWSNGGVWSGGPPGEDAGVMLSYARAYFNSTAGVGAGVGGCGSLTGVYHVDDADPAPDIATGRSATPFLWGGDVCDVAPEADTTPTAGASSSGSPRGGVGGASPTVARSGAAAGSYGRVSGVGFVRVLARLVALMPGKVGCAGQWRLGLGAGWVMAFGAR